MITINTTVTGHQIAVAQSRTLAAGSVGEDYVHFDFDAEWDGLSRTALFWPRGSDTPYAVPVNASDDALIPWEVLDEKRRIKFGVYGVEPGQTTPRITSTVLLVQVPEGAWSDTIANSGDPTPTILEEVQAAVSGAIRFDSAQALTEAQRAQARENIGAGAGGDVAALTDYVRQMSPLLSAGPAALLSIPDAAPLAAEAAVVAIAPSQNLHGYANPWPAGGGANKIDFSQCTAGVTAFDLTSAISGETIRFTGTCSSGGSHSWRFMSINQAQTSAAASLSFKGFVISGGSGLTISSISLHTDGVQLTIALNGLVTNQAYDFVIGIVAYEGATAPTAWTPYSNICPITGWTGTTVRRTGKNLIDDDDRYVYSKNICFEGDNNSYPTFLRAGQYTLSVEFLNDVHYAAYIREENDSANTLLWGSTVSTAQVTFTLSNDGYYRIWLYYSSGVSSDNVGHVQLEPGSVATPNEPYQGDTYTVTFPTPPGTVYGGVLNLTAGTLTVDKAYVVLSDASKWEASESSSYNFLYNVNYSNRKKYDNSFTGLHCSYCAVDATPSADTARWLSAGANRMGLRLSNMTLNQLKTDATAGKIAIVYDLATPTVYTLDPVTLTMLRGANVLWADCGDMTISYRADLPTYIDERTRATRSMIAGIEAGMTATKAYSAGDLLIVGDTLYKAAASIANGATLTPGTNVNATTVAEQLILLANA